MVDNCDLHFTLRLLLTQSLLQTWHFPSFRADSMISFVESTKVYFEHYIFPRDLRYFMLFFSYTPL